MRIDSLPLDCAAALLAENIYVERLPMRMTVLIIAIVTIAMTLQVRGPSSQGTATPTTSLAFEVASIKPIPPPLPSGGGPWIVTRGRFKAETGYVRGMVAWAHNVLGAQVKGGPDWVDREPYYVDARAEDSQAGPDQIRLMLQTLLKDRFKLAVHRETQQGLVYKLVVGKNGSKLQDAKSGLKNYINWTGPGQVTFTENTTLLGLINVLSSLLGAPVVDETGIRGTYNFSLQFTDPRDLRPRQSDSPPDLLDAVQEQLGLQLQATKGPVEVLVIDHMERPSAN
jgi:uncharacterized protein (TIGR03435 family)